MSSASTIATPVPSSRYVNAELYERLMAERREARSLHGADPALSDTCAALLFHEARLLDERRYEDWLALFARECVYWVPMDDEADPRACISIIFDDRRRLEDRILRLRGGFALNQVPEPRLLHQISNVEAWTMPDGRLRVISAQSVHERRAGRHQLSY